MMRNLVLFSVLSALGSQAAPTPQAENGAIAAPDYSKHNTCGPDGTTIYVGDVLETVPAGTKCEGGLLVHASGAANAGPAPGVVLASDEKPAGGNSGDSNSGSGTGTGTETPAPQASGNGGDTQQSPSGSGVAPDPAQTGAGDTSINTAATDSGSTSGSVGTGKFDQTPACDGEARKSDKFRYVGYWYQAHDGKALPEKAQLEGMTHIILAFATTKGTAPAWGMINEFTRTPSNFQATTVADIRGRADPSVKVMAAFGGWGQDLEFPEAAATGSMEALATKMIKFVEDYKLDGIDLDWEYPVNNGAFYIANGQKQEDKSYEADAYIDLMRLLRKKAAESEKGLKDMIISAAVPAIERDLLAFTDKTAPEMDKCLDFWNLMTYDHVNRRSDMSGHHQGGKVIGQTIDLYASRGVDKKKMNLGYGNYAKWFTLTETSTCTPEKPLDCEIIHDEDPTTGDGLSTSGQYLWNTVLADPDIGDDEEGKAVKASRARMVDVSDQHSFQDDQASAWVDGKYFWSWLSPKDITDSCEKYSKDVGGVMHWGINADDGATGGGTHIKAMAECAKGAGA